MFVVTMPSAVFGVKTSLSNGSDNSYRENNGQGEAGTV